MLRPILRVDVVAHLHARARGPQETVQAPLEVPDARDLGPRVDRRRVLVALRAAVRFG